MPNATLDELYALSRHFLEIKNQDYQRYFIRDNPLKQRLSLIVGQRGVGKTTTLIQYLLHAVKNNFKDPSILYIQADHFLMGQTPLYEIAEQFQALGGRLIAFDEIHKYSNWSQELKSIYDTFPDLTVIASGSSALEINRGAYDLSRRAVVHTMYGLSFREYLELYYQLKLKHYSLQDILHHHETIVPDILKEVNNSNKKILPHFVNYLTHGYYPFFLEIKDVPTYQLLIEQNLHTTIEVDLVAIYPHLTGNSIKKIKQLLSYIAQAVPFTPNWQKLKSIVEIGDDRTLKTYLKYLEDAGIIMPIMMATDKLKKIEVPEKIYLNNTNQIAALVFDKANIGTMRETYFANIVSTQAELSLPATGDFLVDGKYFFEVGGRKKSFEQLNGKANAYFACDEIENGIGAKIPLWLFGFLY